MAGTNLRWKILDGLLVTHAVTGVISEDSFDAWCKDVEAKHVSKALTTTVGFAEMNSVQRKRVSELFTRKGIQIAAVTDEAIIRGVVTAISWMGVNIKAFNWNQLTEAIQWLGVTREQEIWAVGTAREFKLSMKAR